MTLTEIVARNVYTLRLRRKMTQQDLARTARFSVSYVSMLERAQRSPPLITIERLAKALRTTPNTLFAQSRAA